MKATMKDKGPVTDILSKAFEGNKSVNFIVQQDDKRLERIRSLMEYSFLTCMDFGKVFISEDRTCCALVLFPDRKKTSLKSIWRVLRLVFSVTGLGFLTKVLKREGLINGRHPDSGKYYYIWFVGVLPDHHHKGSGTKMMESLLSDAQLMNKPVYLETSTERNIPWYRKLGFELYDELDLGYTLYFFRKEN